MNLGHPVEASGVTSLSCQIMFGCDMFGSNMFGCDMFGCNMFGCDMFGCEAESYPGEPSDRDMTHV